MQMSISSLVRGPMLMYTNPFSIPPHQPADQPPCLYSAVHSRIDAFYQFPTIVPWRWILSLYFFRLHNEWWKPPRIFFLLFNFSSTVQRRPACLDEGLCLSLTNSTRVEESNLYYFGMGLLIPVKYMFKKTMTTTTWYAVWKFKWVDLLNIQNLVIRCRFK